MQIGVICPTPGARYCTFGFKLMKDGIILKINSDDGSQDAGARKQKVNELLERRTRLSRKPIQKKGSEEKVGSG